MSNYLRLATTKAPLVPFRNHFPSNPGGGVYVHEQAKGTQVIHLCVTPYNNVPVN